MMLECNNVTKKFDALVAVNDLSFAVAKGEVLGIMGPNGAGKSTLFGLIMGELALTAGTVRFDGTSLSGMPTHAICRLGIGRTYQIPQPFKRMTVLENLCVGQLYGCNRTSLGPARERAMTILQQVGLADKSHTPCGRLGLLDLKRLELARVLSTEPRLLLLDEIAGGLVEREVQALEEIIDGLKSAGHTMIIIEHVLRTLFGCSDRVLVMNFGVKVAEATPAEIIENEAVKNIYLGERLDHRRIRTERSSELVSRQPLLRVDNVSAGYGEFQALFNVSLEIHPGEIVALIGMNGAGKTSLIRAITRQIPLTSGAVLWRGVDLNDYSAHDIAGLGISQCIEGRKIFAHMSVRENLLIGAYPARARAKADETMAWVFDLFPQLKERASQLGGTLSGGEQQMVAVGRALMSLPDLIIFDEISLGLAPRIIDSIYQAIPRIVANGATVLLIEQSVDRSLRFADRAYVLERGRIALAGFADDLLRNPDVQSAYFGLGRDKASVG
jgi:branched-chain amino acid transport system ATP-binding protein